MVESILHKEIPAVQIFAWRKGDVFPDFGYREKTEVASLKRLASFMIDTSPENGRNYVACDSPSLLKVNRHSPSRRALYIYIIPCKPSRGHVAGGVRTPPVFSKVLIQFNRYILYNSVS
jgi:hypothetical protein